MSGYIVAGAVGLFLAVVAFIIKRMPATRE
jgi:hypothetical protein